MSLAISEDVKFDCEKKQLSYAIPADVNEYNNPIDKGYATNSAGVNLRIEPVNRYAIVRKDNGKILAEAVSGDYTIRPYYELAEKVNKVVEECVDIDKYKITTKDQVLDGGKKYRRDINFWDDSIDMSKFKSNGMHIQGAE